MRKVHKLEHLTVHVSPYGHTIEKRKTTCGILIDDSWHITHKKATCKHCIKSLRN